MSVVTQSLMTISGPVAERQTGRSVTAPALPRFQDCRQRLGAGGAAHTGHNRVELGLDGRAQGSHGRDDDDGNQGGDQAVLNGRGARLSDMNLETNLVIGFSFGQGEASC
jgi:hypothetical protein